MIRSLVCWELAAEMFGVLIDKTLCLFGQDKLIKPYPQHQPIGKVTDACALKVTISDVNLARKIKI
jgi:hypothetical protein